MAKENIEEKKIAEKKTSKKKTCGIIMPISPHVDYPADHWNDVLAILFEAIEQTEFEPKLVSDDVAIGLIHDRIVTNIYNNEIVVCDVSSKNPNVMFELGLRLAFDKPTIIVKDENTGYSFDTGVIEHISYPSSLRFGQIVKFKEELIRKVNATYEKSTKEPKYSPFLKSFGKTIVPASLQNTEIPEGKYIMEQISILRQEFRNFAVNNTIRSSNNLGVIRQIDEIRRQNSINSIVDSFKSRMSADVGLDDAYVQFRNEIRKLGIEYSNAELREIFEKEIVQSKTLFTK